LVDRRGLGHDPLSPRQVCVCWRLCPPPRHAWSEFCNQPVKHQSTVLHFNYSR
jgi:hypothetical protein